MGRFQELIRKEIIFIRTTFKTILELKFATFVALSELLSGIILIVSGFLRNPIGDTLTRFAGLVIVILMTNIFIIAHPDWFITQKLFTSEQIFLFIGGFYFLIKGNKV